MSSVSQDPVRTAPDPPGRWITGLSAEMPLLDALELIFQQRCQGVLHYLPRATDRASENIDHVHRLRVACRRLGAVLDVLADGFPETARQNLLTIVGKMRRVCGEARDLDGPLLLLISDAGSFMTGSVVTVDGGHLVSGL